MDSLLFFDTFHFLILAAHVVIFVIIIKCIFLKMHSNYIQSKFCNENCQQYKFKIVYYLKKNRWNTFLSKHFGHFVERVLFRSRSILGLRITCTVYTFEYQSFYWTKTILNMKKNRYRTVSFNCFKYFLTSNSSVHKS